MRNYPEIQLSASVIRGRCGPKNRNMEVKDTAVIPCSEKQKQDGQAIHMFSESSLCNMAIRCRCRDNSTLNCVLSRPTLTYIKVKVIEGGKGGGEGGRGGGRWVGR